MAKGKSRFTQADVVRLIKGARAAGMEITGISLRPDGELEASCRPNDLNRAALSPLQSARLEACTMTIDDAVRLGVLPYLERNIQARKLKRERIRSELVADYGREPSDEEMAMALRAEEISGKTRADRKGTA